MNHKYRVLIVAVLLLLSLLPAVAFADDGGGDKDHERGNGNNSTYGPYASSSTDSGTCGPDWAQDTFKRVFHVKKNSDGTYTVREDFIDGRFTTIGGASPGACETSSPHGTLVNAGVKGVFGGFLQGQVTGGTFNKNGTCSNPCTTAGFIAGFFGPTALYSCTTGVGACSYLFEYFARDQGLIYRQWQNASPDLGGNRGDIANF